jgi:hypothetical protein
MHDMALMLRNAHGKTPPAGLPNTWWIEPFCHLRLRSSNGHS